MPAPLLSLQAQAPSQGESTMGIITDSAGGLLPRAARISAALATPRMMASGRGGQPGTKTSTGMCLLSGPANVRLSMKTLVVAGHDPMATTALGPKTCP